MALTKTQYQFMFFCLLAAAEPHAAFRPKCSSPTSSVSFVSAPDSRGTLEILWSSLFTIFACTWTIQHPNIPEQREGRYPGWKGNLRWGLKGIYENVTLALYTIIAPEIIVVTAVVGLVAARDSSQKLNQGLKQDEGPWTLSHSFYANMGGFVIRTSIMDDSLPYNPYHLTAANLIDLRHSGYLKKLPEITEEELHDKSKSDPLLKAIAIGQISWSVMQITARGFQNLTISPLELSVLAFAACAVIIYALYWKKPKSVRTPITILRYQGQIPSPVLEVLKGSRATTSLAGQYLFHRDSAYRTPRPDGSPIHNMGLPSSKINWATPAAAGFTSAALFGGIHCAGWNFAFPSTIELIAWRCAGVYTAIFGLLAAFWFWGFDVFLLKPTRVGIKKDVALNILDWGVIIMTYLYIFARLFILVEVFRTLLYLPTDAFISTWTSNVPHFS
ncbi:hypothetical protein B0H67DRAFT_529776 [Lasiosphaeris hirsuta]|uniref:Uncharacterized protein n=1 Tax=Lasiosphaeris hirsuta TaxID=260670 RepID=A0AA40E6E9_9PEZI|nr:hypothetical protein B0H67DRAFT_529776 [Lasiosphaeris hirsuta]